MKAKLLLLFALIGMSTSIMAQSMKMIVTNNGQVVARYTRTVNNQYEGMVQDVCYYPMHGHKIVTFSAANGQGIVYRNQSRTGNINVRQAPNVKAAVVAKIADSRGMVPDTYPCLGKENGWYKIRINGKVGYVREDMAYWDGMDTF